MNFFFKFLSVKDKFLFRIGISESPVVFVTVDKGVIDVLDHVAQNANRVRRHLTEKNFLVVGLINVDLYHKRVTFFLFSGKFRKNQTALSLIL